MNSLTYPLYQAVTLEALEEKALEFSPPSIDKWSFSGASSRNAVHITHGNAASHAVVFIGMYSTTCPPKIRVIVSNRTSERLRIDVNVKAAYENHTERRYNAVPLEWSRQDSDWNRRHYGRGL